MSGDPKDLADGAVAAFLVSARDAVKRAMEVTTKLDNATRLNVKPLVSTQELKIILNDLDRLTPKS